MCPCLLSLTGIKEVLSEDGSGALDCNLSFAKLVTLRAIFLVEPT